MDLTWQWRWLEVQTLAGAQTQQFACLQYLKINHILFSWSQMVDKLKLCVFVFEKWEGARMQTMSVCQCLLSSSLGTEHFSPPYLLGEKPRKSTGHIWLSSVLIFLPPPSLPLVFPPHWYLTCTILKHLPYSGFSNLLRTLAYVTHCMSLCVNYMLPLQWMCVLNLPWWKIQRGEFHCQGSK